VERLGIWTDLFDRAPIGEVRERAAELDELGYGALWLPEIGGREALSQAAVVLAATRRMVVATGIASIHARTAEATAAGQRTLDDAYPGRFLLGLGVGRWPGSPVAAMRAYLDPMGPTTVLGSLGPRMIALAAERTKGAFPFGMPVEHTAAARETLGAKRFLGVGMAAVFDHDRERGRRFARSSVANFLPNREKSLRALGYAVDHPDERLADALVVAGDVDRILARVREHVDAGADHVALHVLASEGPKTVVAWRELATHLS